jgi:hypothetical protein
MSGAINPELAEPSSTQAFEQSDRNPFVTELGGADADRGQVPSPSPSESRVTEPGPWSSADEAEREG